MKLKAILTTIPSDSHSWNLIYMQLFLEEHNFEVINLGPCTSYEELEQSCIKIIPDIILVSTVNGHGYLEGKEVIQRIRKIPLMQDVPVFMGGKLSTDKNLSYLYALELEMAGYTKAYYDEHSVGDFTAQIKKLFKKIG